MSWLRPLEPTWIVGIAKQKTQDRVRRGRLTDEQKIYINQHWRQMSLAGLARTCEVTRSCIRHYLERTQK